MRVGAAASPSWRRRTEAAPAQIAQTVRQTDHDMTRLLNRKPGASRSLGCGAVPPAGPPGDQPAAPMSHNAAGAARRPAQSLPVDGLTVAFPLSCPEQSSASRDLETIVCAHGLPLYASQTSPRGGINQLPDLPVARPGSKDADLPLFRSHCGSLLQPLTQTGCGLPGFQN